MSATDFAKTAGVAMSSVSQISTGKRTPPLDAVGSWADLLKLGAESRQKFMDLAALAHIPDQGMRDRFLVWLDKSEQQDQEIAELRTQVRQLKRQVAEAGAGYSADRRKK